MELLKNLEGLSADEQMTAVVELQKAAMKHLEEQKQASIGKSAELVIQGLKKIKSDFEAKFDSLNYDIQTKVASLKDGEQGLQGPKGDQGERGLDGANGRDGRDGKDGKDGVDGVDGVGIRDAKIDFDGSLVISLTDGREINCGEVVSVDVAKQIQKVTHNIQTGAGGDSQTVLDAIAALQATIATYGTMATQNKTSVDIEGGTIDNTTIGATTPSTGVFTTLTATGQTSLGGVAGSEGLRVNSVAGSTNWLDVTGSNSNRVDVTALGPAGSNVALRLSSRGSQPVNFYTIAQTALQFSVSSTVSAVNYVQVTGAATGASPTISAQGSDSAIPMVYAAKGGTSHQFYGSVGGSLQFQIANVSSSVNRFQVAGSTTTNTPVMTAVGTDTNVGMAFISKGTGAIDLAAGSSGVNISNGGTVTAITRTNNGTGYTSAPTVAITAPTTAGGVQATATATVSAGSLTGITITNAGSGYVEQPTVTFSGGGGSGAAAYATVGSGTVIRSLGLTGTQSLSFFTPSGEAVRIRDTGSIGAYSMFSNTASGTTLVAQGTANAFASFNSNGTSSVLFGTNGNSGNTQMVVSHTASAVNYVQVTGSATSPGGSSLSNILFTGSDAAVNGAIVTKGTGYIAFAGGANTGSQAFRVNMTNAVNTGNLIQVQGAAAGAAPSIQAISGTSGTDTNIDLALTPKGTGNVRFGTYTASMALTVQGYIEIKDSGGTVRKLAVVA